MASSEQIRVVIQYNVACSVFLDFPIFLSAPSFDVGALYSISSVHSVQSRNIPVDVKAKLLP